MTGPPPWHALDAGDALRRLESSERGLSSGEAAKRLQRYGPNRLSRTAAIPAWRILLRQLGSIVVALLGVAALIALLLGDVVEAIAIGAVLLLNTLIGFFVELRAHRAMEALLRHQAHSATVVRDDDAATIDAADLVPGDVIVLQAGDSVPGDARLLDESGLKAAEAALTGESVAVSKAAARNAADAPLPERESMVFAGTAIASGAGRAVVVATGAETELGRIGGLLGQIEQEPTPLEHRLDALGRRLVWLTLGVAAVVTAMGWLRGQPLALMLETGVALAIAAVPEGLPAVSTIVLAVGLSRMARRNALVRRLHAVEALGSTTVVCTDKTGTLTAGEMTVTRLAFLDRSIEVTGTGYDPEGTFQAGDAAIEVEDDAALREAVETAALTARVELTRAEGGGWSVRGDPTDAALSVLARKAGGERDRLRARLPERGELPFAEDLRLSASFHEVDGALHALVKGAPADILDRCGRVHTGGGVQPLGDAERQSILDRNDELAQQGLRVIALARGAVERTEPEALRALTFICLVGIMDPAAPGVRDTIDEFRTAGIRTIMITGDQALTAAAVAHQLGLGGRIGGGDAGRAGGESADGEPGADRGIAVLSGAELDAMDDAELRDRLESVPVFSRVSPQRKLDIVRLLQDRGEIVAMLGDGVNDAAALKKADVSVAMGRRGTDVAREVADIVLRDDRFTTVAVAVEEGRIVFDNIRKFIFYLFSCNFAEVLVLFAASAAGLPLPVLPLQILWLNLVTDTFPALALAMEPGESDVMRRPPRDPQAAMLSRPFMRSVGFFALLITVVTMAAFLWGLSDERGHPHAITMAFMTLAFAQLFHLGNGRSSGPVVARERVTANPYALGAVALVIALQLAAITVPPLARLLELRPLTPLDWAVVLVLAAVPAAAGQLLRLRQERAAAAKSEGERQP